MMLFLVTHVKWLTQFVVLGSRLLLKSSTSAYNNEFFIAYTLLGAGVGVKVGQAVDGGDTTGACVGLYSILSQSNSVGGKELFLHTVSLIHW